MVAGWAVHLCLERSHDIHAVRCRSPNLVRDRSVLFLAELEGRQYRLRMHQLRKHGHISLRFAYATVANSGESATRSVHGKWVSAGSRRPGPDAKPRTALRRIQENRVFRQILAQSRLLQSRTTELT